jgi:rod shape determining protein RodA
MRLSRKMLRDFDYWIVAIVLCIAVISVLSVASATRINETGDPSYFYVRQMVWFILGGIAMFVVLLFDYNEIGSHWKILYWAGVASLAVVYLLGTATHGAKSWFDFKFFKFEPGEFMKVILIVSLGQFLAKREEEGFERFRDLFPVFLMISIPFLLIILQPDLGMALMMVGTSLGMFLVAGLRARYFVYMGLMGAAGIGALTALYRFDQRLFFKVIQPYQWDRLTSFLDPYAHIQQTGFQIYESLIAVGSGELNGEGLFRGTQVQGQWVPEDHTDFIFSVISEEMGFLGASILILLYFVLLYRMLRIAMEAKDAFGTYVTAGVMSMFIVQTCENIGMTIGIMPITGITLPLVSYGGSSILTTMMAIGLVLNVGMRRRKILF